MIGVGVGDEVGCSLVVGDVGVIGLYWRNSQWMDRLIG